MSIIKDDIVASLIRITLGGILFGKNEKQVRKNLIQIFKSCDVESTRKFLETSYPKLIPLFDATVLLK